MRSHTASVRGYFDRPEMYLAKNRLIHLRRLVAREMLGAPAGLSILDVGCGDGSISRQFLSENHVTFFDLSQNMLAKAKSQIPAESMFRARFIQGDILHCPVRKAFDVVLCIGVLAHCEDVERAIAELSSLVKAGGKCLIQITDSETTVGRLLKVYVSLRLALLGVRQTTPLASLSHREVVAFAASRGLVLSMDRRHFPLPPAVRHLWPWFCDTYYRWSYTSTISRWGSEVLLLFERC